MAIVSYVAPIAAFLISGAISYVLSHYGGRWAVLDHPNRRSLHQVPLPRIGGIAIILGAVIVCMATREGIGWLPASLLLPSGLAFLVVIAVSFLDDVFKLSILVRLAGQLIAALLVVWWGGMTLNSLALAGWSLPLPVSGGSIFAVLVLVWMTNLYNFMDGMDGFAGGMGVVGFGTFAILGGLEGAFGFAQINLIIAAACGGFLLLNFPPAKLFMGDVGAASLGFLAAFLALWADHSGIFPLWIGVLTFSPFVIDATWTLLRRALEGKKPWQSHREHFYQRLVCLGWGHRKTVLCEYGLMLSCAILAVSLNLANDFSVQIVGLGLIILGYIFLGLLIRKMELHR